MLLNKQSRAEEDRYYRTLIRRTHGQTQRWFILCPMLCIALDREKANVKQWFINKIHWTRQQQAWDRLEHIHCTVENKQFKTTCTCLLNKW